MGPDMIGSFSKRRGIVTNPQNGSAVPSMFDNGRESGHIFPHLTRRLGVRAIDEGRP
jgi:hypothetical protein